MGEVLMWVIADTTDGFFLEYWLFPERRCILSMKGDCPLEDLESAMRMLRELKIEPR
jgi:hypothetical protein